MKKRALDMCCKAGGATKGLQQAGYYVVGVDIDRQPNYCGDWFIQGDALDVDWTGYDLIWASPPCQRYSKLTPTTHKESHPDLLPVFLDRLRSQTTPYVVENVDGTQGMMKNPVFLCGTMFGLNVWRHRWFEIGNSDTFFLLPPCNHQGHPVLISGRGMRKMEDGTRIKEASVQARADAIGINWMNGKELDDAIPPVYSKFLAEEIDKWRS